MIFESWNNTASKELKAARVADQRTVEMYMGAQKTNKELNG